MFRRKIRAFYRQMFGVLADVQREPHTDDEGLFMSPLCIERRSQHAVLQIGSIRALISVERYEAAR